MTRKEESWWGKWLWVVPQQQKKQRAEDRGEAEGLEVW